MSAASLRFESKVIVEHVSQSGPRVTAVRGSMVLRAHRFLKDAGGFEAYEAAMPVEHRDIILGVLAASWVPEAAMIAHFRTMDSLAHSGTQLARMGASLGTQIMDSLFSSLIRTAQSAGAEAGIWLTLKQTERTWPRMFQGGGVSVIQTGPKDAILEIHGMPVASSRYFQLSFVAFVRTTVMMVAKACVVKPVPARKPHPDSFAISISWV